MNNDLIRRSDATAHPFANGKYDHDNADKAFIRGYESYKEWLESLPPVEQPMSAVEYERVRGRFVRWCDLRKCEWCEWKLNCRDLAELSSLSPEERVEFFMEWAKENPERSDEK